LLDLLNMREGQGQLLGRIPLPLLRESVHRTNAVGAAIVNAVGPVRQRVEIGVAGFSLWSESDEVLARDRRPDALAHGYHLAEPAHGGRQELEHAVDLGVSCRRAEGQAQRGVGELWTAADRQENVGRILGAGVTGRAGRSIDIFALQLEQDRLPSWQCCGVVPEAMTRSDR